MQIATGGQEDCDTHEVSSVELHIQKFTKSAQLFRINEIIKIQEEPLSTQMRTYLCWKHWEILLSLLLEPRPLRCIVLHPEALSDHLFWRHTETSADQSELYIQTPTKS